MNNPGQYLEKMRSQTPLIHNITNFVAMNSMANILLAAGAAPAMVHSTEEVEEFATISDALTLNIGTLEPDWVAAMLIAAEVMNRLGRPWVFDPVGVGATTYRKAAAAQILALKPSVIRGNASEILALGGMTNSGKGVDSGDSVDDAEEAAKMLATHTGAIVAVTGKTDFVTDGTRYHRIPHGSQLMTRVTTLGCSLNGVIAAFCVRQPLYEATIAALTYYGLAGEQAEQNSAGPGSFEVAFIDALANLNADQINAKARIEQV